MARDLTVELRRLIVDRLNDPASATGALLGDKGTSGPASDDGPVWPFVRMDLPTLTPVPDSCTDAAAYTFRIHGFSKGPDERGSSALGDAVIRDMDGLDGALVAVPDAYLTDCLWTGTQHLRDTVEPDGWHAVISMVCRVDG